MNVPNHEKKAFKDLTPEERSAIVEAWLGGSVDIYAVGKWQNPADDYIVAHQPYRTRPRKLVIPWDVFKKEIKFVFVGKSGQVYGCEYKPHQMDDFYDGWKPDGKWRRIDECIVIDTTGIDWRESLVQRPE